MKTGFINGCFDILHIGHIEMLNECKSKVNVLIVAIDEDSRIKKAKGINRPFNNTEDRKKMLMNLKAVDVVFSFSSDEELKNLVKCLKPDIMMVGEEYKSKNVIGSQYAKEVKFFRRLSGYSTTKILQNTVSR
jgi:rfaE bifunctional protein nucleotidyltransferase chain/domain